MDDIYWNSVEFGSEESLTNSQPGKQYIDPWDLENYAYIRQHLDSADVSPEMSSSSGEFNAEVNSTSFYYVPGVKRIPDSRSQAVRNDRDYAAIEEIVVNADYKNEGHYNEDSDLDDYSPNARHSIYGWQQPVLPRVSSRNRSTSFSYGDNGEDIYGVKQEIYARLEDHNNSPLYDDIKLNRKKPPNFSLSNYGHLKIDYSYSWNNLDKYICN